MVYTIRSERRLIEELDYNLLYRWFVDLGMDEPVWHATTFTKNRDRLVGGAIAEAFLAGVLRQAEQRGLLSGEHFTVDGTLLEETELSGPCDHGEPPWAGRRDRGR